MNKYILLGSKEKLWKGAMLGTIVHAIWVSQHPELAYLQSWDGINYNVQNYEGALGTVTFAEEGIVAVFFDAHSSKNPFSSDTNYELMSFFSGIPDDLLSLAQDQALQYVIQELEGVDRPIITTAFWSEGEDFIAPEPWDEVFSDGAHLVQTQLLDTDAAIATWQSYYGLSPVQLEIIRSIYSRKLATPNQHITLSVQEKTIISSEAAPGLLHTRELLENVGITLP